MYAPHISIKLHMFSGYSVLLPIIVVILNMMAYVSWVTVFLLNVCRAKQNTVKKLNWIKNGESAFLRKSKIAEFLLTYVCNVTSVI